MSPQYPNANVHCNFQIKVASVTGYSDDEDDDEDEADYDDSWQLVPCPCCPTDNNHGYVCPEPIMGSIHMNGMLNYPVQGHLRCCRCLKSFPTGWKPYRCDQCSEIFCGSMFNCSLIQNSQSSHTITQLTGSASDLLREFH
jgi:hypothetical protein